MTRTSQNQQAPDEGTSTDVDQPIPQLLEPSGITCKMTVFKEKEAHLKENRKVFSKVCKEPAVISGNVRKSCATDFRIVGERIGGLEECTKELSILPGTLNSKSYTRK